MSMGESPKFDFTQRPVRIVGRKCYMGDEEMEEFEDRGYKALKR